MNGDGPQTASGARVPDTNGFRVNPIVFEITLLDDLNLTLADMLATLRERPAGNLVPAAGVQSGVTPTTERFDPPLFGFSLTNDGPNTLQYNVGDPQVWCVLKPNETIQTDMRHAIIGRIAFRCAAGETAAWRLTAVR